jgi:hypothetical protein
MEQMKEMVTKLVVTGVHLDRNFHLQADDRRAQELARADGVMRGTGVAICGA